MIDHSSSWVSNPFFLIVRFCQANPLRTASESDEHKKITKEEHFIDEYVAVKGVLLGALNSGQDEVTAVLINRFLSCHKGEEPSTPSESPKMVRITLMSNVVGMLYILDL
jgi:hypothetical protein